MNEQLLSEVLLLNQYLNPYLYGMIPYHVPRRDASQIEIREGKMFIRSWMISGHNGDSYDFKEELISDEAEQEKTLKYLKNKLYKEAVEKKALEIKIERENRVKANDIDMAKEYFEKYLGKNSLFL